MENDYEKLRALNIGSAETRGDQEFFQTLIADTFAMRRADGQLEDRGRFITKVEQSGERVTEIQAITFFEANRALVSCAVTMETVDRATRFHNVRLLTRPLANSDWQLLAWAHERMS